MNIQLLQAELKRNADPGLTIFDPRFSEIVTLVQEAKYEDAASMSEEIIAQEIYDIRIIGYFLYGHFLDQGIAAIAEIYQCIIGLLGEQLEAVGPVKKREKHIQSILNWLMKQLHRKMKHEEEKNTELYQLWISQATSDQVQLALDSGEQLRHVLSLVLKDDGDSVLDGFLKVNDWLQAFQKLVYHEDEPEEEYTDNEEIMDQNDQLDINSAIEVEQEIDADQPTTPTNFNFTDLGLQGDDSKDNYFQESYALVLLLNKIKAFEHLISDDKFSSAALVGDDINDILANFDPKLYFPKMFAHFSLLFATHINQLTAYEAYRETVQWHAMQELYKVDLESFVNFNPAILDLEASIDTSNEESEYDSSDDQDDLSSGNDEVDPDDDQW